MARSEERAVTILLEGDAGIALDGIYTAGDDDDAGGVVVAPPHPLYGGSMDSPVVSEIAWACSRAGSRVVALQLARRWRKRRRFERRRRRRARRLRRGDRAARRTVSGRLLAAGYSFGAAAAARAAASEPRVRGLILVAPPPSMLDRAALASRPRDVLILTGEHDSLAPAATLEAIAAELPRARFAQIEEADHFFGAGLAEIGKQITKWLPPA